MATSGVTAWSLTARDLITEALTESGVYDCTEGIEAAHAEKCLFRLNALLKGWPVGLHLQSEATVSVPANSSSGTIAADVEQVLAVRLVQSATYERPLTRWERDEYLSLPNKASSGTPSIFYAAEHLDECALYLWPVQTTDITLRIDYIRKPQTITDLGQTVDFPQKYQGALYAMLAVRCAGLFGAQVSPELAQRAERERRAIEDAERPSEYTLGYCH